MDLNSFVSNQLSTAPYSRDNDTYTHFDSGVKIRKEHGLTIIFPFHYEIPDDLCPNIYPLLEENRLTRMPFPKSIIRVNPYYYDEMRKHTMIRFPYVVEEVYYTDRKDISLVFTLLYGCNFIYEIPHDSVVLVGGHKSSIFFRTEEERLAFVLSQ